MGNIKFLPGEVWYGGAVYEGYQQPVDEVQDISWDLRKNDTPNQAMPVFLSSKGRYFYNKEGFLVHFNKGTIEIEGARDLIVKEDCGNLRGAYLEAMKAHFPFRNITLSSRFFEAPVYNTWIELTFYQEQEKVLEYAQAILDHGMPAGVLMIDDGWSPYYGKWEFRKDNFPEAEEMIKKLHAMGFQVMLWLCPFITADTVEYREAKKLHLLIEDSAGKPRMVEWWNGYSAALDLTNEKALQWLKNKLDALMELGVDGFKFDAGESYYYREDDCTYEKVTANEMSRRWAEFAQQYTLNELRVCFGAGGYSLMQRLCDKHHSWDENGVGGLIPDSVIQGLTGHPFGSPDMIGGGEYMNFWERYETDFEPELFLRYCEVASMMPVMQFSAAPWRVLNGENFERVKKALHIREEYLPIILETVNMAKETGEPVLRAMEYEFPNQGMEKVMDQFMIGDKLLVAPVYEKGKNGRSVVIPAGSWRLEGKIEEGNGKAVNFASELGSPIVLERIK